MASNKELKFFATSAKFNVGLKFSLPLTATADDLYRKLESWVQDGVPSPPHKLFLADLAGVGLARNEHPLADYVEPDVLADTPDLTLRVLVKRASSFESIKQTYGDHAILNYFQEPKVPTLLQELLLENEIDALAGFHSTMAVEEWCAVVGLSSLFVFGQEHHLWGMNLLALAVGIKRFDLARKLLEKWAHTMTSIPYRFESQMNVNFNVLSQLLDVAGVIELDWILRVCLRQSKHADAALAFFQDNLNKPLAGSLRFDQFLWGRILAHSYEDSCNHVLPRLFQMLRHQQFDGAACLSFMKSQNAPTFAPGQFKTLAHLLEHFGPVFASTLDANSSLNLFLEVAKYCNHAPAMDLMIQVFPMHAKASSSTRERDPLILALTFRKDADEAVRLEIIRLLLKAGASPIAQYPGDLPSAFEIVLYRKDLRMIELMLSHSPCFFVRDAQSLRDCLIGDVPIVQVILAKYHHLLTCLNPPAASYDRGDRITSLCWSLKSYEILFQGDPRWMRSDGGAWKEQDNAAWNLLTRKGIALLNAAVATWKESKSSAIPNELPERTRAAYHAYVTLLFKKSKWDTALTETLPFINDPDRSELLPPNAPTTAALLCCHKMNNIKGCKKYASMLQFGPYSNFSLDISAHQIWEQYNVPEPEPAPSTKASGKKSASKGDAKKAAPAPVSPASSAPKPGSPSVTVPKGVVVTDYEPEDEQVNSTQQQSTAAPSSPSPSQSPSVSAQPTTSPSSKQGPPRSKVKLPECPVCMEHVSDHALAPCGHTFCGDCARALQSCGQCRSPIVAVVKLYFA